MTHFYMVFEGKSKGIPQTIGIFKLAKDRC